MSEEQVTQRKHEVERHGREDLAGEHLVADRGQLLFAFAFVLVWLLDSFVLRWTTFLNGQVSLWIRLPLAAVLFGVAIWMVKSGMTAVFGREGHDDRVVQEGAFAYLRHPIYFGELLVYLGCLMLSLSLMGAVIALGAAGFLWWLCRYEEELLVERYGEAYRSYQREVPMWIPRPRRNLGSR